MKTMQVTFTGMLLLGLLSGFAPTALSCSTNPCDKEKLSSDNVETLVECSGSRCAEIITEPTRTLVGCEGNNCRDAKLLPDVLDHKYNATRAPFYYMECSVGQCPQGDQGQQAWHIG